MRAAHTPSGHLPFGVAFPNLGDQDGSTLREWAIDLGLLDATGRLEANGRASDIWADPNVNVGPVVFARIAPFRQQSIESLIPDKRIKRRLKSPHSIGLIAHWPDT